MAEPDPTIPEVPEIPEIPEVSEVLEPQREGRRFSRWHLAWLGIIPVIALGLWWFRKPVAKVTNQVKTEIKVKTPVSEPVGGRLTKITPVGSLSATQVNYQSRYIYYDGALQPARFGVRQFNITYTSVDARNGRQISVTGRLYLPQNASKRPLIAFGPGTTGVGPQCAPTLERLSHKNWGSYDSVLTFYAGQGYAVAMTDYASRTGAGVISPYFVGESEGRVMLDLVRAAQKFRFEPEFRGPAVGKEIFLSGYSQGGHAALWAEKLQPKYAPEIKTAGILLFAPATDMLKTFYDSAAGATTNWLPPYLFAAYEDYYGVSTPARAIFTPKYSPTVERDARKYCINDVEPFASSGIEYFGTPGTLGKLYTPAFLQGMKSKDLSGAAPNLAKLMVNNLAGEPVDVPVLLISGRKDQVILKSAQTELAHRICRGGETNFRWELSNENHYSRMFNVSRGQVLGWLSEIVQGRPPASECSSYAS